MKMIEKVKNSIVFYYKAILLVFLIPTLLVPCVSYCYQLMFVMLGLGAILLLVDLFTNRNFLKARGMFWLIGFMIVFAGSVVINYKTSGLDAFKLNAASWGYSAIALLLLYPDAYGKTKERSLFELSVLNNIFIAMTCVLSTISIGMFICLYNKEVAFNDQVYSMGWSHNRLFGLYSNTGYMITALAIALTILQIVIMKARGKKISFLYGFFIGFTTFVNYMSMCLENAKGAFISLFTFVAVAVFFAVAKALKDKKNIEGLKSYFISAVAATLSVVIFIGMITISRKGFSYVPSIYRSLGGEFYVGDISNGYNAENENGLTEGEKELQGVDIDRNIPEEYGFFTGRVEIWKFGLEQFKAKPILGYGPQSHRDAYIVDNYLRHFHNLIVQIIVSVGAVGSVFIFAFFAIIVLFLLKNMFIQLKKNDKYYYVLATLFALLGMFAMNSMAEVTILFLTRFSMFIFWMYIGYIQVFVDDDKKLKTNLLLEKLDLFIGNILNKITGKKQGKNEK